MQILKKRCNKNLQVSKYQFSFFDNNARERYILRKQESETERECVCVRVCVWVRERERERNLK